MKKIVCILLAFSIMLALCACGAEPSGGGQTAQSTSSEDGGAAGGVTVETKLFNVTLTIPTEFTGEGMTQEECDRIAEENGYQSVTLNEDGSVTYVVTKAQHKEMMREISDSIEESLNEMVGSAEYPNVVSIEKNSDYTQYTVTTKSETLDLTESFMTLGLYLFSGMYHAFNGTTIDNVTVQFVNEASGEVIETANSSDVG